MPTPVELLLFARTSRKFLSCAIKSLPADAGNHGLDKQRLEHLMTTKKWNDATRILIDYGHTQEDHGKRMGGSFWDSLYRLAYMMKMADVIMLCKHYRDDQLGHGS